MQKETATLFAIRDQILTNFEVDQEISDKLDTFLQ